MRLLTPEQAVALDKQTFQDAAFRSEDFARQAAHAVFVKMIELGWRRDRVLALVGPGHNGLDARYVAEELRAAGAGVIEWTLGKSLLDENLPWNEIDAVVDGLFGVGLNRELGPEAAALVERLNSERSRRRETGKPLRVMAIDVPSGFNALTGLPLGKTAVRADATVTMQAAKPGFFQNQGPSFTGAVFIAPLPYPKELFQSLAGTHFACGIRAASRLIPRRPLSANKGNFGTLNLIAGSGRYPGAGILAARAALRSGVGYLKFVHFDDLPEEWMQVPETLPEHWKKIPGDLKADQAWVLGPGVTDRPMLREAVDALLKKKAARVVLDATALELIPEMNRMLPATWLLTPHPKELAKLLEMSVEQVQSDRFAAAARAHRRYGASILLKGYKTIVHSQGRSYVALRGNQALAKAGSGDVLSGMIGSYMAQGKNAVQAAVLGATTQGLAADLWLRQGDSASLNPSDLIDLLPIVQKQIKNTRG